MDTVFNNFIKFLPQSFLDGTPCYRFQCGDMVAGEQGLYVVIEENAYRGSIKYHYFSMDGARGCGFEREIEYMAFRRNNEEDVFSWLGDIHDIIRTFLLSKEDLNVNSLNFQNLVMHLKLKDI